MYSLHLIRGIFRFVHSKYRFDQTSNYLSTLNVQRIGSSFRLSVKIVKLLERHRALRLEHVLHHISEKMHRSYAWFILYSLAQTWSQNPRELACQLLLGSLCTHRKIVLCRKKCVFVTKKRLFFVTKKNYFCSKKK